MTLIAVRLEGKFPSDLPHPPSHPLLLASLWWCTKKQKSLFFCSIRRHVEGNTAPARPVHSWNSGDRKWIYPTRPSILIVPPAASSNSLPTPRSSCSHFYRSWTLSRSRLRRIISLQLPLLHTSTRYIVVCFLIRFTDDFSPHALKPDSYTGTP